MTRKEFYADLKVIGEAEVRDRLLGGYYKPKKRKWAKEWIETRAESRKEDRHRRALKPVWASVAVTVLIFIGSCGKELLGLIDGK